MARIVVAQAQALPLAMDVAPGAARFYGSLIIRTSSSLAPVFTSTVEMFPTLGASNLGSKNYARCNNSRCHDKIFFSVFWPEVRLLARHGEQAAQPAGL